MTSVALNLVLIGVILSFLFGNHQHQPLVTWQVELLSTLNPADAEIVKSATQRISEQQAGGDSRIHIDYTHTRAILAVEPLDRDALQRALGDIATTRNSEQIAIGGIFLDELVALSPDGRAKVLAGMERESRRRSAASGH